MTKHANTDHPVHELIARRWSPYGLADRPVAREDLLSLFEAARWAPSSYNEQPWRWIVATRDDPEQFERVLSCLVEPNQEWARQAPVLVLCCTRKVFERNGKPNRASAHDIGLASANLTLEATARGLSVHQMIGVLPDRAREVFGIPEDAELVTALAIGYAADPDDLPEKMRERDTKPRSRRPLGELMYGGQWGQTSPLAG
jgi:nitroreductase